MNSVPDSPRKAAARIGALLVSPAALLTLGFAAIYLATFDSDMGSPDERQRYALGVELARRGLSALKGSGGMSMYPPLQSLLAAPLMKLGLALDGGADGLWTHRLGLSLSLIATVGLIPLFYWIARTLQLAPRRAALATALFGLTNPVWPYSKRFFSEPLTAVLALGAFAGALAYARRGRRVALAFGLACLALMPLNNMVIPVAVGAAVGLILLLERRWRAIAALAGATAIGGGLVVATAIARYGKLTSGYGQYEFWWNTLDGLHGLLFGWGRSVFVYAPLIVLSLLGAPALWRRSRAAAAACLAASAIAIFIIANWWSWWGGICWGPRLVLPILPITSVGAIAFLAEPRRWKIAPAVVVLAAGLYVQLIAVAFKHDFDIYFWMSGDYHDERKAWFEWEYSPVRRMPRHFREHPWDLSSAFLTRVPRGPSIVELDGRPVKAVQLTHRGDALMLDWSITDIFAVVREGGAERRVPARELGVKITTFNGRDGTPALDGNPATRWSTGRKRLDGDWVRLELPATRSDLVRLELEHAPHEGDFPNGLEVRVDADGFPPTLVPARAATPKLVWSPWIFVLAASGLVLIGASLRRSAEGRKPAP